MSQIVKAAVADANCYEEADFDGVIVENYGDSPFYPMRVPPETVAALAVAAAAVKSNINIPCGVNCLRNDGLAALAVASAAELDFVRINVLTGIAAADQGLIAGEAHELLRARARLRPNVNIFADVHVKHASSMGGRPIGDEARDARERALADAIIISGPRTGEAPDRARFVNVRNALGPRAPLLVGSGLTIKNANALLTIADGAIVGTSVKVGGETTAPVDRTRARALARFVRSL